MTIKVPVGARFAVREELRFEKDGEIIANYLPWMNPYVTTEVNAEFVSEQVAAGKVVIVSFGPPRRQAGGFVQVG